MPFDAASFWTVFQRRIGTQLPLRVLLSYYYFRRVDLNTFLPQVFGTLPVQLFLDSGAFSAATQQELLRVTDYIAWVKRYRHWFETISNLDVIGDWHTTARHQALMEDAGIHVLPVFHTGEPWSQLETLLPRYAYIGLGGMVPYMKAWRTRLMPWLVRCFRLARGQSVFHGFGCTTADIMKALPWQSVDSSTWSVGFLFGEVPLFAWNRGLLHRIRLGQRPSPFWQQMIRELRFQMADFTDRLRNTRAVNGAMAVLSYRLFSTWLGPIV